MFKPTLLRILGLFRFSVAKIIKSYGIKKWKLKLALISLYLHYKNYNHNNFANNRQS